MQKYILPIVYFALLLTCISGCGDGLCSLKGKITIDGQPAPKGVNLEFVPTDPNQLPSYGSSDENGDYEAYFTFKKKGIQPGEYTAKLGPSTVEERMPEFGADGKPIASETPGNPLKGVSREYSQGFETFTVKPGSNTKDFDLKTGE